MSNSKNQFDKFAQDATNISRDNIEALNKSIAIATKGYEGIMKDVISFSQSLVEKNNQALKTILSCRTANEAAEAQTKLAQQNFDSLISNATKLSEECVKIATQSFEPINSQINKNIKKATDSVAA